VVAIILVGIAGVFAVFSVMPRQHKLEAGLIAWNGILQIRSSEQYRTLISRLSDGGLEETSSHSYRLAEILKTKYRLLCVAVLAFILGIAATVILVISSVFSQNKTHPVGAATCSMKADLQGVQVLDLWNPNSIKLDYLVTNRSAEDYVLPDRYRVMRMTSDGVLHSHFENITPRCKKFPALT
jgi:hypothetical protein